MALLECPLGDPFINRELWKSTDEMMVDAERRIALEQNGLRVGQIVSMTPGALQDLLKSERACLNPRRRLLPAGQTVTVKAGGVGEADLPIDPAKFRARRAFKVAVTDLPTVAEVEPNDAIENAQLVRVPAYVGGSIGKPGDVFWTGVGCVHGFANVGSQPVTWLETFAPQPPKENVFRFMAEWERRAQELEG